MADRDNITPLRPRRPPPRTERKLIDLNRPQHKVLLTHALVWATFVLHFVLSFPLELIGLAAAIAAIAIATSNRYDGMPWARTHHEFALRTLLIGGAIWIISGMMGFIPFIGLLVLLTHFAVLGWVSVRCAVGLWRAGKRKPTPNPRTMLI